jgi:hypothetical protein
MDVEAHQISIHFRNEQLKRRFARAVGRRDFEPKTHPSLTRIWGGDSISLGDAVKDEGSMKKSEPVGPFGGRRY